MAIPATPEKKYTAAQKAFVALTNLKVGSKVTVEKSCRDNQYGWGSDWDSDEMDDMVDETYEVEEIHDTFGLYLDCGYYVPFFVVDVIDDSYIKISDDYEATINDDGSIDVGCQHIPYKLLKTIYESANNRINDSKVKK